MIEAVVVTLPSISEIFFLLWIPAGIIGTLFRKDLVEDEKIQSGLFPIFAWIGPMIGGMMFGYLAFIIGISVYIDEKRAMK